MSNGGAVVGNFLALGPNLSIASQSGVASYLRDFIALYYHTCGWRSASALPYFNNKFYYVGMYVI